MQLTPVLQEGNRSARDISMQVRVPDLDPTRLAGASKHLDPNYAPATVILPATSALRKPGPGRVWHDQAAGRAPGRRFSPRRIQFAATLARVIDQPFLATEMVLFDHNRIYLDTSIEMEYSSGKSMLDVKERFSAAVAASSGFPVNHRFGKETVLISHHEGGSTWGHYLVQSIPRMLVFLDAFPKGKIAVPAWHAQGAPGFGEALELYGISNDRLVPVEEEAVYRFKRAVVHDFLFHFGLAAPHPKVLPLLRRFKLKGKVSLPAARGAFIKRRLDAKRAIANQQAVDEVMARNGIAIYGPDELPLRRQIEIWRRHDLLIATLGSDLTNMVYARPGTKLLVLSPDWFGDSFFFELSVAAGMQWHELRCAGMSKRDEEIRHSCFLVDTDLLDSILRGLLR